MALKAYSLARDGALHLTPHFRVREFACRDGSDPIFVEEELAALLEAIRLHFGCPVAITSGFRTAAHNASIPGASPHSQHLYGRAADFRVEGVSVAEAAAYAETLLPGKGGIGRYPPRKGRACGWVHLDTRSTKALAGTAQQLVGQGQRQRGGASHGRGRDLAGLFHRGFSFLLFWW